MMKAVVRSPFVLLLLIAACGSGTEAEVQDSTVTAEVTVLPAPPPPSASAQGPIQARDDANVTVASVRYAVVAGQTVIRRGGVVVPFSVVQPGDSAYVKGSPAADGTLVAQVVDVVLVSSPLPMIVGMNGPIAVGADSITILGQTVRVDAHTLIIRGGRTIVPLSNLRQGETAQVSAKPGADGRLLAMIIGVR
jgi:hypothetical protein